MEHKSMLHIKCDGDMYRFPTVALKEEAEDAFLRLCSSEGDFLRFRVSDGTTLHLRKSMISF